MRHRPRKLKGFASDPELKNEIKSYLKQDCPHLLLIGKPGTGKTTLALIIGRAITGDMFEHDFIEINASDNRGKSLIDRKVKPFVSTLGWGKRKVILLDESDSIEPLVQKALRRLMEQYAHNCLFIFTGNDEYGFEDAIKSRCRVIEFKGIEQSHILERLKQIAKKERMDISDNRLNRIVKKSFGDMRNAIKYLRVEKAKTHA